MVKTNMILKRNFKKQKNIMLVMRVLLVVLLSGCGYNSMYATGDAMIAASQPERVAPKGSL